MPSNALSSRRTRISRPIVCRPSPLGPPAAVACSVQIIPPNYPFHLGFLLCNACHEGRPPGEALDTIAVTVTPDVPGLWNVQPLNCTLQGTWEFQLLPPSGPLTAEVVYKWFDATICIAIDNLTIP